DNVLSVDLHLHEVHHSDLAVLVGAEIVLLRLEIAGRSPNRIVGQDIAVLVLLVFAGRALWDVELVQDMERLKNCVVPRLWLKDRMAERDRANEARRRREVSR